VALYFFLYIKVCTIINDVTGTTALFLLKLFTNYYEDRRASCDRLRDSKRITVKLQLSGLIGSTSHPDMEKIRTIGFFFENRPQWHRLK